jgi:hypothetical protein
MKKLLFPMAMILLLAIGCLAAPAVLNKPPIAYIDSVSPTNSTYGDPVTFTGHGIDPDGTVVAYNWRASPEGDLSTEASFTTSSLTPGSHAVWFRVQDNSGAWSDEVMAIVNVVAPGATSPVIISFNASPGSISPGGSSTLSWNVSGAATVSIGPAIGNVSLTGNRVVFPTATTTYTLTATNVVGTVTATAQITVSPGAVPTVELFPIAGESGHVRQDGEVGPDIIVGATSWSVSIQGFLSYDISMIPNNATITSVSLDMTAGNVFGSPFNTMGQLYICNQVYGSLNSNDFTIGPPTLSMYSVAQMPTGPVSSSAMIAAVQEQVDNGGSRFQIRLQFVGSPVQQSYPTQWSEAWKTNPTNDIEFTQTLPELVIQYE